MKFLPKNSFLLKNSISQTQSKQALNAPTKTYRDAFSLKLYLWNKKVKHLMPALLVEQALSNPL